MPSVVSQKEIYRWDHYFRPVGEIKISGKCLMAAYWRQCSVVHCVYKTIRCNRLGRLKFHLTSLLAFTAPATDHGPYKRCFLGASEQKKSKFCNISYLHTHSACAAALVMSIYWGALVTPSSPRGRSFKEKTENCAGYFASRAKTWREISPRVTVAVCTTHKKAFQSAAPGGHESCF